MFTEVLESAVLSLSMVSEHEKRIKARIVVIVKNAFENVLFDFFILMLILKYTYYTSPEVFEKYNFYWSFSGNNSQCLIRILCERKMLSAF